MMRLDKYLTECGIGTRTEVKKIIRSGRITVNDLPVKGADFKVDENADLVTCDGKEVCYEEFIYYLLNKPQGCVTANQDRTHKTVMDYLPEEVKKKCAPVGRLDKDTEGLLLLTNDGELSHFLRSPAHHISKCYFAKLDTQVPEEAVLEMAEGIDIGDDKPTKPAKLEICPDGISAYITITEGRYHQVKRMFGKYGCKVIYLQRISMGNLRLEGLELGEYRKLSNKEIESLKNSN